MLAPRRYLVSLAVAVWFTRPRRGAAVTDILLRRSVLVHELPGVPPQCDVADLKRRSGLLRCRLISNEVGLCATSEDFDVCLAG